MTLSLERARELRFKACFRYECRLNGVTAREVLSDSQRAPLPSIRLRIFVRLRKVPPREGCQRADSLFPVMWLAQALGRDHSTLIKGAAATERQTWKRAQQRRGLVTGLDAYRTAPALGSAERATLARQCRHAFSIGKDTSEIARLYHIPEHLADRLRREARGLGCVGGMRPPSFVRRLPNGVDGRSCRGA